MLSKIIHAIEPRHIGLFALCCLAFVYMALFRYDAFGIDEGAARALLINWSIIDHVANATPLFGFPDLRAIMFIFLDLHWAGSLPAAKVFTLFMLLGTALMFYRWSEVYDSPETGTIATALLLISPIAIMQTDSISPGVFLLFCFATAFWMNYYLQRTIRTMSASLFMLILMSAFAVSLHPMGLALPLVLCLQWLPKQNDHHALNHDITTQISADKRRNLLIGLGISTALLLFVRWGWSGLETSNSPLASLGAILTGSPILQATPPIGFGVIMASLLGFVIVTYIYQRNVELLSSTLVIASLIGIFQPDHSWALIALTCILFLGLPMLIAAHRKTGIQSIIGQRGLVILLIIIFSSIFTSADKHYRTISQLKLKSDSDNLLAAAARIASNHKVDFIMASQWPARTMLVTKRDVLPLPPQSLLQDEDTFIKKTASVTHFMFNPNAPENAALSKISARLSQRMQAVELLPAGVILEVNTPKAPE
ncbi:MAG: hypothetical protein Q9M14_01180 [Mariprofundaceae bacterium]|nr:hypothetical protein [Mariprofundaceae bacterium]